MTIEPTRIVEAVSVLPAETEVGAIAVAAIAVIGGALFALRMVGEARANGRSHVVVPVTSTASPGRSLQDSIPG